MVGERVQGLVDREPFWRKVEDRISNPGHSIRKSVNGVVSGRVPRFQHRNFGGGLGAGTVGAGVGVILEDVIGVPFGGSSDTIDVTPASGGSGTVYTVNVNAPTEDIAEVRAYIDAGTGFTSLLTDTLDVQSTEIIGTRTLRDTYQVQLKIED